MKKLLTAFLPFILVAQLPISTARFIPSEWIKSFHYGLKWTELMMNGYPGAEETPQESIPEGEVTTTVVMAGAIPDVEMVHISLDKELLDSEFCEKIAIQASEAVRIRMEVQKIRSTELKRLRVVHM